MVSETEAAAPALNELSVTPPLQDHIIPEESHVISEETHLSCQNEGNVISKESHVIPKESHMAHKVCHVTTEEYHVTKSEDCPVNQEIALSVEVCVEEVEEHTVSITVSQVVQLYS